jgi:hypothetical protein
MVVFERPEDARGKMQISLSHPWLRHITDLECYRLGLISRIPES